MESRTNSQRFSRRSVLRLGGAVAATTVLGVVAQACSAAPAPPSAVPSPLVVEKVVTQIVEKQVTQVVEKQVPVTQVVQQTVIVQVTPTPAPASYAGTAPQGRKFSFKGIIHVPTWYSRTEPGAAVRYYQGELIREWAKLHPDADIEMFAVAGGDIRQWMRAQFVADTPPELAIYYPASDEFINGWWRPIDDLLDQTSPYTNKAWKEDFPYIDVVMTPDSNTNKRYQIPIIKSGDAAFYNVGYNADIYRKAGIDVDKDMPPKNWSDWKRMNADIKKAGFIPVSLEITGGLYWQGQHIELPLTEQTADQTLKKIDVAVDPTDTILAGAALSSKQLISAVATGALDYSKDKGFREAYRLMKEFFTTMAQPSWSAPSDLQSTYLPRAWYQGKVGAVHVGLHYISELQQLPFEWRTMWWPALSKDDTDVPLGPIRRDGSDAPAGNGTEPIVIPAKTAKNDQLFAAALDLIQYTTRPDANKYWCSHQLVPCFDPGKTEKDIWANDERMQKAMYGLFHPPIKGRTMRRAHMEAWGEVVERPAFQTLVEYFQDKTSLDEATQKIQALVMDRAKKQCSDLKLSFCGKFA